MGTYSLTFNNCDDLKFSCMIIKFTVSYSYALYPYLVIFEVDILGKEENTRTADFLISVTFKFVKTAEWVTGCFNTERPGILLSILNFQVLGQLHTYTLLEYIYKLHMVRYSWYFEKNVLISTEEWHFT